MKLTSRHLLVVALTALIAGHVQFGRADEPACESHGTAVNFVDSPAVAAKAAKEKEKLVFVLHVSGLFEKPEYT